MADLRVTDRHGNEVLQGVSADFAIEGQGRLVEEGTSLVNGHGRAIIRGAHEALEENYLRVQVAGVEKKFPYRVGVFHVRPIAQDVYSDTEVALAFSLEGIDAASLNPAAFEIGVDKGLILDCLGKVEQGRLVYRWHTGFFPGKATVSFSNGSGSRETLEYQILPKPGSRVVNRKPVVLLVGMTDTEITYHRWNGESVRVPVRSSDTLTIKGTPGEQLPLTLGDFNNPNRQTLLSLAPSQMERGRFVQGDQELAVSPGFRYQLSRLDNQPIALNYKGYPLALSQISELETAAIGEGLDVDLVYELDGAGHLFSWRDVFTLEQDVDELRITYKNAAGQQESRVVALSQQPPIRNLKLSIKNSVSTIGWVLHRALLNWMVRLRRHQAFPFMFSVRRERSCASYI